MQPQGPPQRVCHREQFRVRAAFRAPNQAARAPFFEAEARCRPVRLKLRCIDHKRLCLAPLIGVFHRHPCEYPLVAPRFPVAIKRLRRTLSRWRWQDCAVISPYSLQANAKCEILYHHEVYFARQPLLDWSIATAQGLPAAPW